MYRYVDELGQENDLMADKNQKLDTMIEHYENLHKLNKEERNTQVS